jgi:AraC-like DNA-binding protein
VNRSVALSCPDCSRPAPAGRTRHAPWEDLSRHRHDHGFVALVLGGGYIEAGDTGRHEVGPGDVVAHRPFESHLDRFDARGAEVLVLPLPADWEAPVRGRAADPDAIVRAAERSTTEAADLLRQALDPTAHATADWPDLLARDLRADPSLKLEDWAEAAGLHAASVSRGFRQVFAVTPAAFRLVQRSHQAIAAITRTAVPLAAVAQDCGFADQAHMTRAVVQLSGVTPSALRGGRGA